MRKSILFLMLFFTHSILSAQVNFRTLFEKSGFVSTDDYQSTINYFQKLAESSEYARMVEFGVSPQGRKLYYLVADRDKEFYPEEDNAYRSKAVVMIQNGIHSGEIEGKDACMLLLREILITKEKLSLLDKVKLVVIPIFNVDGHERRSPYNRINQNGPKEMGWRTTAQNYNLNRDYMKADTPEMRALLKLFNKFNPDIYIDTHTTDGADYQYTISYGIDTHLLKYEKQKEWIKSNLKPFIESYLKRAGYLISPYVGFVKGDFRNGIKDWISLPRFSHGYAALRNRVGILIETHMLKPYKERVFSTKSFLEGILEIASKESDLIIKNSIEADRFASEWYPNKFYPIKLTITEQADSFFYLGKKTYPDSSYIAGRPVIKFSNEPLNVVVPYYHSSKVIDSLEVPLAYVIPSEYYNLIDIVKLHNIVVDTLKEEREAEAIKTKFKNVEFPSFSYEGRFSPRFDFIEYEQNVTLNKGDFIIRSNQPSIGLIVYLFSPKSADSFLKWGFINQIFERKEYFEEYSMEPIAEAMYDSDAELRMEFETKLKNDPEFAKNARERLNFFYERSKYFDKKINVYPVLKIKEFID